MAPSGDDSAVADVRQRDEELLTRVAGGDSAALGEFYDLYSDRVLGLLMHTLRERADAEDVLQEVFLQVWQRAEQFNPERGSPAAWLFLIARSRAVDRIRRRKREGGAPLLDDQALPSMLLDNLDRSESAQRAVNALMRLPEEQRRAIVLAFYEGLTQEQIADRQAIPLGTVKTRIRLGMQRLRDMMASAERAVV